MISEDQVRKALPSSGFLRSYVEWASKWTGATLAFHVVSGLTLLSQSVPIDYSFPWTNPLHTNFFGLLIGPSGAAGKGRSIGAARSVLSSAVPGSEMEQPGSPEGCLESLEGKPQIIFYDEFGNFLQSTQVGQLSALRTLYTNLYDCVAVGRRLVDRPGRKRKAPEPNPRLSILAGGTPIFLEEFTTATDWEGGFLGRFFLVYGTSEGTPPAAFEGTRERDRLGELLASYLGRANAGPDIFPNSLPRPGKCVGWSAGAERLWYAWLAGVNRRREDAPEHARSSMARAADYAIKIAMLLSWDLGIARSGMDWVIEIDTFEYATALTELHIQSVIEIAEGLVFDREAMDERALIRAFTSRDPRSFGEALRIAKLSKRRGQLALETLMEKSILARVPDSDITAPPKYRLVAASNVVIPFRRRDESGPIPPTVEEDPTKMPPIF